MNRTGLWSRASFAREYPKDPSSRCDSGDPARFCSRPAHVIASVSSDGMGEPLGTPLGDPVSTTTNALAAMNVSALVTAVVRVCARAVAERHHRHGENRRPAG
jgi:hypothetical protein